jgi:signal transduction histidine kinase
MAAVVDNLIVRAQDLAGELTITLGTVDLREVASGVIRSVAWLYPDKVIRFRAGTPILAWADPSRVRQVIRNLVSNGLQHGGDHIDVEAGSSDGGPVTLSVTDDALGPITCGGSLPLRPFEKTSPVFASPTLGLGLPTSLRLAELMGGTLTHRHTPGVSTFTLTLPPDRQTPRSPVLATSSV